MKAIHYLESVGMQSWELIQESGLGHEVLSAMTCMIGQEVRVNRLESQRNYYELSDGCRKALKAHRDELKRQEEERRQAAFKRQHGIS